ncbi:MAG TPA: ABC transporter ATP-binding protein [Pyrinomonadaceae bacterium]|jgi:ABC-type polysaccharide/polyol phosphate transport system ATPase subunit|nr:ABC transporter ATP-binding protein [Pyrinomonadaceae bacterium]
MSIALRVEGVSKQYRIYDHPGDRLKESITRGRWKCHREFWALSDINFEIEAGTTTGIIGPNGSGKSTLLQIITGTLEPTHGRVWHDGRIAALLELGAGFDQEFTGIENIFMNAALLGYSRRETEALLPEIERFAEIGAFIHQPVKTYSSGMYVRLAFSIAVSTAPQILIIDEALAVGDAVFQHRCTRRIKEMQESGVTILFVSHDPGAIRALCSRALLLNGGHVEADGKPSDVLNRYQRIIMAREEAYDTSQPATLTEDAATEDENDLLIEEPSAPLSYIYRHGDRSAEFLSVEILDEARQPVEIVESGAPILVRERVLFHADIDDPVCGFLIRNRHGIHLYGSNTELLEVSFGQVLRGEVLEVVFAFDCWLAPGLYSLTVAAHTREGVSFDWIDGVSYFRVASPVEMEGVANLNATAKGRRLGLRSRRESANLTRPVEV